MTQNTETQSAEELRKQKVEAYSAWLEDCGVSFEKASLGAPKGWKPFIDPTGEVFADSCHIRLAPTPATSIPYHNPEGVTEEQLEPMKGWRFLTRDEISPKNPEPFCAHWKGLVWATECNSHGAFLTWTYRTKAPLPAKYAHLEEAKAFAARSAFAAYKLNEGERLVWRGPHWYDNYFHTYLRFDPENGEIERWETTCPGHSTRFCYYAEIIRETAEDVAKRLLFETQPEGYSKAEFLGIGPIQKEDGYLYGLYVIHSEKSQWIWTCDPNGLSSGAFYVRARKLEPELVPYTMETWPLGAWVRLAIEPIPSFPVNVSVNHIRTITYGLIPYDELLRSWEITTDAGHTWRKCGREAR